MIIPEGTPQSPSKTDTQSQSQFTSTSETLPPPPSYAASSSTGYYPQGQEFAASRVPLLQSPKPSFTFRESDVQRRTVRRFLKALGIAFVIYLLMGGLVGSGFAPSKRRRGGDHGNTIVQGDEVEPRPIPEWPDHPTWGPGTNCPPAWSSIDRSSSDPSDSAGLKPPHSMKLSFDLDPSAPSLLLVATNTYGDIRLRHTSSSRDGRIKVDVTAYYYTNEALNRASVCKIEKKDGGEGVEFYVSSPKRHPEDEVAFSIVVSFPVHDKNPLRIQSFETDLHLFDHHLEHLYQAVSFQNLKLSTTNMRIQADSVFAQTMDLSTSNAAIKGSFHSNQSLALKTNNSPIDATITLDSDAHANSGVASKLVLFTSNSAINARISLGNSENSPSGGRYDVSSKTSNSRSEIEIVKSPHTSFLKLVSETSNSDNNVQLHPAFEGSFRASTSSFMQAGISVNVHIPDPSGQGRRREARILGMKGGNSQGRVSWGVWDDKKDYYGQVEVKTSLGNVVLKM